VKSRQLETHKQRLPHNSRGAVVPTIHGSAPTVVRAMTVLGSHCHSNSFLSCAEFLIYLANIARKQQLRVPLGLQVTPDLNSKLYSTFWWRSCPCDSTASTASSEVEG